MIKYTIKGETPSKKNSRNIFVRGGRPVNIPSKNYKEWHDDAVNQLQAQGAKPFPEKEVSITVVFYPRTLRPFDLSNKLESVADLLVDCGIIEDDNWKIVPEISAKIGIKDKDNPRAEIFLI